MASSNTDKVVPNQKHIYHIEAKDLQHGLAKMYRNTCLFDMKVVYVNFTLTKFC